MTIFYDYFDLEERATHQLRLWKAWHIILFILIAIFGIMNFTFLHNTMALVDDKCIFYPRKLEFVMIKVPNDTKNNLFNAEKVVFLREGERIETFTKSDEADNFTERYNVKATEIKEQEITPEADAVTNSDIIKTATEDINSLNNEENRNSQFGNDINSEDYEIVVKMSNETIVIGNKTQRLVLNTNRTLFCNSSDCEFAEFMPLMSTVVAIIWIIFFSLCPAGGRSTKNWRHPWHILTPALTCCVVLVCVTGYSFSITNAGLHQFCAGFFNLTGSLTCSSVNPFLPSSWQDNPSSWGFGNRVSAVRAASAGVWAGWACAAALLMARCLTVRDFMVRKKSVRVRSDPFRKVLPHLTHEQLTSVLDESANSPDPKATASQLVTACVERRSLTPPMPKIVVTPTKEVEMTSRINPRLSRDQPIVKDTTI